MLTCPRSSLSFHSNAHHHGSLPQQLGVVWDLLLKADPEGPSPIFHAALRHRFHTHTGTPSHVSLQHTMVKKVASIVHDHEPNMVCGESSHPARSILGDGISLAIAISHGDCFERTGPVARRGLDHKINRSIEVP